MTGTAAWFLWSLIKQFWFDHTLNTLSLLLNGVIILLLAGSALRGGKLSTGCLMFLYVGALIPIALFAGLLVVVAALLPVNLMSPGHHAPDLRVNEMSLQALLHDPVGALSLLAMTAWVGFACWILFRSGDARLYREVRRREAADTADADASGHPERVAEVTRSIP